MKTAVIVQARMGSSRFPGKALADLNGKPVLWHVLKNAKRILAARHALACPDTDGAAFSPLAQECGFELFDGHEGERDVLGKFFSVASKLRADVIVRITGDCPLIDPAACNRLVAERRARNVSYHANIFPQRIAASGFDCEVFTYGLLIVAHRSARDAYDREHVTPWMQRFIQERGLGPKLSVDTPEDLQRVRDHLASRGHHASPAALAVS